MTRVLALAVVTTFLFLTDGCSRQDENETETRAKRVREKSGQAAQEVKKEAESFTSAVKDETRKLASDARVQINGNSGAKEKLRKGAADLKGEGEHAAQKLDYAATITKVKSKLASAIGLSSITNIEVEPSGHTIRLRGTVGSAEQKQQAERAVLELDGVTKVVNELQVNH